MVALALANLIKFENIVQGASPELGDDLAASELVDRYRAITDDALVLAA